MKVRRTEVFAKWLREIKDARVRFVIVKRINRLSEGNPGNSRSVGGGIVELKIDFGPGYRVYYVEKGAVLTVILCGGDKSTQEGDIRRAKRIAAELTDDFLTDEE